MSKNNNNFTLIVTIHNRTTSPTNDEHNHNSKVSNTERKIVEDLTEPPHIDESWRTKTENTNPKLYFLLIPCLTRESLETKRENDELVYWLTNFYIN